MSEDVQHRDEITSSIRELAPRYQRRALRAVGPLIEAPSDLFREVSPGSDPTLLYYVIKYCLDGSKHAGLLKEYADHSANWVAAEALAKLARHPRQNESLIREKLSDRSRGPVLIRLLKVLYGERVQGFEEALVSLLQTCERSQVTFYAGILLERTSPESFSKIVASDPYLETLRNRVEVSRQK